MTHSIMSENGGAVKREQSAPVLGKSAPHPAPPRRSLLASGTLLCRDRMPEGRDVIRFPGDLSRACEYLVLGEDRETGDLEGHIVACPEWSFRFTAADVRENAVYVSRADGGPVSAERGKAA